MIPGKLIPSDPWEAYEEGYKAGQLAMRERAASLVDVAEVSFGPPVDPMPTLAGALRALALEEPK